MGVTTRSVLINTDQLSLGVLGCANVAELFPPRDLGPFEIIPRKAVTTELDNLQHDAMALATESGRILRSRYAQRPQS
jgi:hypothetical protein